MSDLVSTNTEMLLSQAKSLVKQYIELDGASRPSKVYTVKTDAIDGDPCTVTEYIYASPSSSQIIGRKEGHALWDTSWVDSSFTVTA